MKMLTHQRANSHLAQQDVSLNDALTIERFVMMEPLLAHAQTAFTTPLTIYATQSRVVRRTNFNSKMSVGPVLLVALPAEKQTH
jgi:hypothetical protein